MNKNDCPTCKQVPELKTGMSRAEVLAAYLELDDWEWPRDSPRIPGVSRMDADEIAEAFELAGLEPPAVQLVPVASLNRAQRRALEKKRKEKR